MKPIVVIGLGNPLMGDEGVGAHVARALAAQADSFPEVEFINAGAAGLKILHLMADRDAVIFVDCALMGEQPGTLRRFTPEEAASVKHIGFSAHEEDLMRVIALSQSLGECPPKTLIFGIQPKIIAPGEHLSPTLTMRLPDYCAAVIAELTAMPPCHRNRCAPP